jgi:hypothetical protein
MRYVILALMLSAITHSACQDPEPIQTAKIVVWVHSVIGYLPPHEDEWTGKYDEIPERNGDPNEVIEYLDLKWHDRLFIDDHISGNWGRAKLRLNWDGETYCDSSMGV